LIACNAHVTDLFKTLGVTRRHFILWCACHSIRHGVFQRYKTHLKSATRNIHLLLNWPRIQLVTGLWYLTKFFFLVNRVRTS